MISNVSGEKAEEEDEDKTPAADESGAGVNADAVAHVMDAMQRLSAEPPSKLHG